MFSSKADKKKAAKQAVAPRIAPSLIAANMSIVGNLKSDGEVQIDGTLEGDIVCSKLLVGENARLHGEVCAKEVVVRGHVHGLIKGGAVHLAKSARVVGDITHDSLAIDSGAHLEGHCRRREKDEPAPMQTAAKAQLPLKQQAPQKPGVAAAAQAHAGQSPSAVRKAAAGS